MAELFTIIGEALVLVAQVVAAWAHALLEGLIVLACFIFSRSFRVKKLEQWRLHPRKKFVELGLASLWFALVIVLPIFIFLPSGKRPVKGEPVDSVLAKAHTNEDLRVEVKTKGTNNQQTMGVVVVKKGGVTKILDTKSLKELKTQIVENVSFVRTPASNTISTIER